MSMTRSEIEILIKARNEAQGAFDSLNQQVKRITGEADQATQKMGGLGEKTKGSGAAATAAGVAFGNLAVTVGNRLLQGFQDTIQAANRLDASMVGLGAQAKAFNVNADAATAAARGLAKDGLMSVGDAASGLKNLLGAGFGLDQAVVLMNRFKDSAAFGRQGTLAFGQAIVGATEGIKNGNSALVDNAGVTKNLSVILQEAGLSANDLQKASSDVNVRMALFNGILKETNPQLGNTALYLDTAAGKQAQFNSQVETAQAQIGKALQPALSSLLGVLGPLATAIGNNANALVPLGMAVAAVVGPLAAMKAASALGIPTLTQLGASAISMTTAFKTARLESESLRGAMNAMALQGGLTVDNLGLVRTAALAAGAAFVGWQIGRVVAELTGLDDVVARTGARLFGWSDAAQRAGNVQDTLRRAIEKGAPANIQFGDAVKYLTAMEGIRQGQIDKSAEAQRRRVEGQLALNIVTKEEANNILALIAAEESAQNVAKNRISLTTAQTAATNKFNGEIKATGVPLADLLKSLKQNEDTFESWAKTVGLSDSTVKRLKDSLQAQEQQQKKNEAATKKATAAQEEMKKALESMGIITLPGVNERLKELQTQMDYATSKGNPLLTVVRTMWPEFMKLAEQAKASGVGLNVVTDAMQKVGERSGFLLPATKSFADLKLTIPTVDRSMQPLVNSIRAAEKNQNDLNAAYAYFGIKTPQELQKVAAEASRSYATLLERGTATTEQLKAAYQKMIDAQKTASGQLPDFWEREVFPRISNSMETLSTAINGSFAQMLIGAKGFKDGFIDIWESIRKSVLNILNSILATFLNAFLKGMTGAMAGQSGAWSKAFSGIMGGGAEYAGLAKQGVGLAGGAGKLLPAAGFVGYTGTAGSASAGTGATTATGGSALAGLAAPLAGAAVGGVVGWKVGRATGSYTKGIVAGAGAGAATGALVGTAVGGPVIGTAVGAGVGALFGWLGARKANKEADKDMKAVRDQLTATFGDLEKVKEAAALVGVDIGKAFGLKGVKGVKEFNSTVADFETKWNDLDAATKRYGVTLDELKGIAPLDPLQTAADTLAKDLKVLTTNGLSTETALKKMAPAYNDLITAALDAGQKIPASFEPVLQQMLKMGLITDDVQRRLLGLTDGVTVDFEAMQAKAEEYGIDLGALGGKFQSARLGEAAKQIWEDFEMLRLSGADVGGVLLGMKEEVSDLVNESIRFGTEIPANMAPMVTELQRAGLLTDENGDKLADLSKVKFAAPIEEGFDKVVNAIKDLASALQKDLPGAFDAGLTEVERRAREANVPAVRVPVEYDYPEGGPSASQYIPPGTQIYGPNGEVITVPGAAKGLQATRPSLVLFGEGGQPEVGGPKDFFVDVFKKLGLDSLGEGGGRTGGLMQSITVRVPLNISTRQLGEAVFEITPDMLLRKGLLRG